MPDGNQSRSDSAPREATPRLAIPTLADLRVMEGFAPFESADADEFSDQGFALLNLLSASFHNSCAMGPAGIERGGLFHENLIQTRRHDIIAQALDGITTLFALSVHFNDVHRAEQSNAELDRREGR
ncbi:hypothetical protein [Sphingobium chungbukense]|uniref:Uncharacterized protein n=1 Tax=Sphingobium chungbukense TaxID=56193 RepID=A0A0M3ATK3_9SPHN|nr:hypothetical protein [Sphingobium chungbukense]KKW92266.1 hypothetical protein YP76_10065 [Sphingobium chungbukense]